MTTILKDRTARLAAGISILLHLILLLIFFMFKLDLLPRPTEFTEIVLISGTSWQASALAAEQPAPIAKIDQQHSAETANVVNLPPRPMPKDEPPLKMPERPEQISQEQPKKILEPSAAKDHDASPDLQPTTAGAEQQPIVSENEGLMPTDKPFPARAISSESLGQTPFHIEGQATGRTVVFKLIPEYPQDRQVMATIKISFTILLNGDVGEMIPVIKSDAILEKITLDALRQWKFNPLPSDVPQRVERGVITFRYLLK